MRQAAPGARRSPEGQPCDRQELRRGREAFYGHPPESGLCIACQQDSERPGPEVNGDDS